MSKIIQDEATDCCQLRIKGEWWDEWWEPTGRNGGLVLVHETAPKTNTKMDAVAILIAALFANDGSLTGGILQHAQGRGDGSWNEPTIPAVTTSDTTLLDEAGRKSPTSIVFLDAFDVPTVTRTNVIRISTTYLTTDLAGQTLREQGLFGGDATATIDTGIIINVIRHAPIYKSGAAQLIRNIKLTIT